MSNDELRMYIVVRKDVGEVISRGKFGVQCSHAILSAWIDCLKKDPKRAWAYHTASQPKIVTEVKDEKALRTMYGKARESHFHTALITDAGRTEFAHPTVTAIAIGPVWYKEEAQTGFIKRLQIYRETTPAATIEVARRIISMVTDCAADTALLTPNVAAELNALVTAAHQRGFRDGSDAAKTAPDPEVSLAVSG